MLIKFIKESFIIKHIRSAEIHSQVDEQVDSFVNDVPASSNNRTLDLTSSMSNDDAIITTSSRTTRKRPLATELWSR